MVLSIGRLVLPLACSLVVAAAAAAADVAHTIPNQLIMMGKPESLAEMPEDVRKNAQHTLSLNDPSMKFQWFGDKSCQKYIKDHYDKELLHMFDTTTTGAYRADICRAAVLYREGGFYLDVDVQMAMPVFNMVDDNATFASAYAKENGDIFNAVIAAAPKSEILGETIKEMRKWYRGEAERKGLMGTQAMYRGMQNAVRRSCGMADLTAKKNVARWTCGKHNIIMYEEGDLMCFANDNDPHKDRWNHECPPERRDGNYLLRLGLFPAGQNLFVGRPLLGWSRFSACKSADGKCGFGYAEGADTPV